MSELLQVDERLMIIEALNRYTWGDDGRVIKKIVQEIPGAETGAINGR